MITIFFVGGGGRGGEAGIFWGGSFYPLNTLDRNLPTGMVAAFLLLKMPSTVYARKLLVETNV